MLRKVLPNTFSRGTLPDDRDEMVTEEPESERRGRKRVLVVDDAPTITRMLRILLESEGYSVAAAESAERALELARKERPDLVLLDLWLPRMQGWELFDCLKRLYPCLEIAVFTADARGEEEARRRGVPCLLKPMDIDALLELVARLTQ